jgi:alpha-L-arabinofuranosidase
MNRRSFLGALAVTPLRAQNAEAEITILPGEPIGTISPLVYGQFAEHIGRVVYEGIWVGPGSTIENRQGFRMDTLRALERVRPAVVRWPGGCFADTYHWEDGVGPPEKRPKRRNHWWLRDEPNTFGTDEFLAWCGITGAAPYLSLNVGSGSVTEALQWVEYCNGTSGAHAAMRVRNGHPAPYGVRWWGIGNENWGCGGQLTPAEYAQQFRQYAVYLKRLGMTTGLELVGVGHTADNWNRKFLEAVGGGLPYLDHVSIHNYFRRGHSTQFTDNEYRELMLDLTPFEGMIREALAAIDAVEPLRRKIPVFGKLERKPLGLIIDEWGVWHSDPTIDAGFRQNGVLREALFAAACLNLFHRYANRITMTNIAQVINCLQSLILTDGAAFTLTPTFHVYEMYRGHQGAQSVRVELERSPRITLGERGVPSLSASASVSGASALVTLVNLSPDADADVSVTLRGRTARSAKAQNLTGESVRAQNTAAAPNAVSSKRWEVRVEGSRLRSRVPARSVQAIQVDLLG